MGCQQCGRQPGDLHCNFEGGCVNDDGYEPRNDWACDPAKYMPAERECCGTFTGSPHRVTCAKYRGKHKPSNAIGEGPGAASCARSLSTDGLERKR